MLITEQDLLKLLNLKIGDRIRLNKSPYIVAVICLDDEYNKNIGFRIGKNGEFQRLNKLIGITLEKVQLIKE